MNHRGEFCSLKCQASRQTAPRQAHYAAHPRIREQQYLREKWDQDPRGNWLHQAITAARSRAKQEGVAFDLDPSAIALPETCPATGLKLDYSRFRGVARQDSPSIDRLVGALGYVTANVRIASWRANRLKKDMTLAEVETRAKRATSPRTRADLEGIVAWMRFR